MMKQVVFFVLSILPLTIAFAPTSVVNANFGFRYTGTLFAGQRDEDSGGGAAIASPKTKTRQKVVQKQKQKSKQKAKVHDPISRKQEEEELEDAPMFNLFLFGDESYDVGHVVESLCAIVDNVDEDQAQTIFLMAQQSEEALIGKYPLEDAERYKDQLLRSDPMIYADFEDENGNNK